MSIAVNNIKQWIKWVITLLIPIMIFAIPTNEIYSRELSIYLAITIFCILLLAFEFFNVLIPSLLLPGLYAFSGIVAPDIAFASFANLNTFMFAGGFILGYALEECGLIQRIVYWCITKCGGKFSKTLYALLITGVVVMTVSFSNAWIMLVPIGITICRTMKFAPGSKEADIVMEVTYMACTTTMVFLYTPLFCGIMESSAVVADPGIKIMWWHQIMYNWPVLVYCFIYIFLLTKLYKLDKNPGGNSKEYFAEQYLKLGKMNNKEKKAIVILALLMLYIVTTPIHGYNTVYGFIFFPLLFFMPGIDVATSKSINRVSMSTIFFMAACMGIGTVGAALHVAQLYQVTVVPIITVMGTTFFPVAVVILGIIGNLAMTPTAMFGSFPTALVQASLNMGISPMATCMTFMLTVDLIFLPYETSGSVAVFACGYSTMKGFIKLQTIRIIGFLVFFAIIMVPYWRFMGWFWL